MYTQSMIEHIKDQQSYLDYKLNRLQHNHWAHIR